MNKIKTDKHLDIVITDLVINTILKLSFLKYNFLLLYSPARIQGCS